jgi:hypothetical protein
MVETSAAREKMGKVQTDEKLGFESISTHVISASVHFKLCVSGVEKEA